MNYCRNETLKKYLKLKSIMVINLDIDNKGDFFTRKIGQKYCKNSSFMII